MSKNTIEINQYKLSPASVSVWGEIYGAIQDQKDLINLLDSYLGSAKWGQIEGNINEQEDLINLLSQYVDRETVEQAFATYDAGIKAWVEAKGYLTHHQDISGKADVSYVDAKISDVRDDIPSLEGYATETYVDTKISEVESEIPSVEGLASVSYVDAKISDVESQIPSLEGYATQTWVEGQGYLTEHQPIKTINSQSLIGTGDIVIESGGQKYNEVDTVEDLDDLTPNQGDIAVVANALTNVLTKDFIEGDDWDIERGVQHTFSIKGVPTGMSYVEWNIRIQTDHSNYMYGVTYSNGSYFKRDENDLQEWDGTPWSIIANVGDTVQSAGYSGSAQGIAETFALTKSVSNVAYEYKNGAWGQTTNKEYVDAAAASAKNQAIQNTNINAVKKIYAYQEPEGSYGAETGAVAYKDDTYWVKLRDNYQPTGWKSINEFNKFFKYTTVNDRDADTYACENGNICEVLGEQQGTEEASIMSQDMLMNPWNYFEAGKTYTFSIKDGTTPNDFVALFHYRSNGSFQVFGPQYNWNIPSVWGKWDYENMRFVAWDGTPFTVEIPSNADNIYSDNRQGAWQDSYQWFDITTEVPVYGPSTFYIYENGWKQLVVANDLKTINQQSIVGSGDIEISGGNTDEIEDVVATGYVALNTKVDDEIERLEGIIPDVSNYYTKTVVDAKIRVEEIRRDKEIEKSDAIVAQAIYFLTQNS